MRNILFYKYVEIKDVQAFRDEHQALLESLNLKGKILVAEEGINGCITGDEPNIQKYKDHMHADPRFEDLEFKEGQTNDHNFRKTIVRIRPQIITTRKWDADPNNAAPYIEPQELKELYESGEEFYIVDARNDYECKVGKFENAIVPPIAKFSEWADFVKSIEHLKDKPIVTYCTGGIRCEKASAYMRDQGFKNVKQLHGGIIRYGANEGDNHWEGECFVFDERGSIQIDPDKQSDPKSKCDICHLPAEESQTCKNNVCQKSFIVCDECKESLENCCSKVCRNTSRTNQKEGASS